MIPRIWISEITFSDGNKVTIDKNDIVVLVGPNNAGKSAFLKETAKLLRHKVPSTGKVVRDINIERDGNEAELFEFLETVSRQQSSVNRGSNFIGFNFNILETGASIYWNAFKNGIGDLYEIFINALTTEERLKAANAAENIKIISESIKHPIHFLQKDDSIEFRFSDYFRKAFGTDLIVHRNAGREVPLYVGKRPIPKTGEDRNSTNYLRELESLDLLESQGDGMRSFVGVLLNAFISNHSVLFIDEPEAFLHPPQARLLGKMLASELPSERQLFLATHNEDFLKGLIDAGTSNLKIIRIQREDRINKISVLDSTNVNNLWKDSILRHSNILNGLFHTKVVICESDSDCRFFSALLHAQFDGKNTIVPDILFVHCGGKDRIPIVIKALKKLNVPLKVIVDFDILGDSYPLKEIYNDLGGNWSEIEKYWIRVKTAIDNKKPEILFEDFRTGIEKLFKSNPENIVSKSTIKEMQKMFKKTSAWSQAKEFGKSYIPSGDATSGFDRIQTKFKQIGFLVIETGEVESFVKSVGNHGPKWVNEVLLKDLYSDPELENARLFVNQILS